MTPWNELIKDPDWSQISDEEKNKIRDIYFNNIQQDPDWNNISDTEKEYFKKTIYGDSLQPEEPTTREIPWEEAGQKPSLVKEIISQPERIVSQALNDSLYGITYKAVRGKEIGEDIPILKKPNPRAMQVWGNSFADKVGKIIEDAGVMSAQILMEAPLYATGTKLGGMAAKALLKESGKQAIERTVKEGIKKGLTSEDIISNVVKLAKDSFNVADDVAAKALLETTPKGVVKALATSIKESPVKSVLRNAIESAGTFSVPGTLKTGVEQAGEVARGNTTASEALKATVETAKNEALTGAALGGAGKIMELLPVAKLIKKPSAFLIETAVLTAMPTMLNEGQTFNLESFATNAAGLGMLKSIGKVTNLIKEAQQNKKLDKLKILNEIKQGKEITPEEESNLKNTITAIDAEIKESPENAQKVISEIENVIAKQESKPVEEKPIIPEIKETKPVEKMTVEEIKLELENTRNQLKAIQPETKKAPIETIEAVKEGEALVPKTEEVVKENVEPTVQESLKVGRKPKEPKPEAIPATPEQKIDGGKVEPLKEENKDPVLSEKEIKLVEGLERTKKSEYELKVARGDIKEELSAESKKNFNKEHDEYLKNLPNILDYYKNRAESDKVITAKNLLKNAGGNDILDVKRAIKAKALFENANYVGIEYYDSINLLNKLKEKYKTQKPEIKKIKNKPEDTTLDFMGTQHIYRAAEAGSKKLGEFVDNITYKAKNEVEKRLPTTRYTDDIGYVAKTMQDIEDRSGSVKAKLKKYNKMAEKNKSPELKKRISRLKVWDEVYDLANNIPNVRRDKRQAHIYEFYKKMDNIISYSKTNPKSYNKISEILYDSDFNENTFRKKELSKEENIIYQKMRNIIDNDWPEVLKQYTAEFYKDNPKRAAAEVAKIEEKLSRLKGTYLPHIRKEGNFAVWVSVEDIATGGSYGKPGKTKTALLRIAGTKAEAEKEVKILEAYNKKSNKILNKWQDQEIERLKRYLSEIELKEDTSDEKVQKKIDNINAKIDRLSEDSNYKMTIHTDLAKKVPEDIYNDIKNADIVNFLDNANLDNPEEIRQKVDELRKKRGFGRHFLSRKNIMGYEGDPMNTEIFGEKQPDPLDLIKNHISGGIGYLTKGEAAAKYSDLLLNKVPEGDTSEDLKYLKSFIKDDLKNSEPIDRTVNNVKAFLAVSGMGLRMLTPGIDLLQPLSIGIAEFSKFEDAKGQRLGVKLASKEVLSAQRDMALGNLNKWENDFLNQTYKKSSSEVQYIKDVVQNFEGPGQTAYNKMISGSLIFKKKSEQFNREVVALAAARLAKKNNPNISIDEALNISDKWNNAINFNYTKTGRAPYMRNKAISTIFTLASYRQHYFKWLKNQIRDREFKSILTHAAVQLAAGGLKALPAYQLIKWMYEQDSEKTLETEMRNKLEDYGFSRKLADGIPGLFDISIGASLQTNIPTSFRDISGMPGAVAQDALKFIKAYKEKDTRQMLENFPLMPQVVQDITKRYFEMTEGKQKNGKRIPYSVAPNMILNSLGIKTTQQAQEQELYSDIYLKNKNLDDRTSLINQYQAAALSKDKERIKEALKDIAEHNKNNQTIKAQQIKGKDLSRARKDYKFKSKEERREFLKGFQKIK